MKKQKIQFIVILIVLAVLIAATFGMKWYNKNKEEEKTAGINAKVERRVYFYKGWGYMDL